MAAITPPTIDSSEANMIEATVIERRGVRILTTTVTCDTCGNYSRFGPGKPRNTPRGDYAKFLLKQKGWSFGKYHTCPACLAKKGGAAANVPPTKQGRLEYSAQICPTCKGTGEHYHEYSEGGYLCCETCDGSGEL